LALFSTAIGTMLRSVDVLRLTVEDVTDDAETMPAMSYEITFRQQKPGEADVVGISDHTRKVLRHWIIARSSPRTIFERLLLAPTAGLAAATSNLRRLALWTPLEKQ
jgi:hypothetical protein